MRRDVNLSADADMVKGWTNFAGRNHGVRVLVPFYTRSEIDSLLEAA